MVIDLKNIEYKWFCWNFDWFFEKKLRTITLKGTCTLFINLFIEYLCQVIIKTCYKFIFFHTIFGVFTGFYIY